MAARRRVVIGPKPEPIQHWCDHPGCYERAPWGHGVSLLRGIRGRHYCTQHAPRDLFPHLARLDAAKSGRAESEV